MNTLFVNISEVYQLISGAFLTCHYVCVSTGISDGPDASELPRWPPYLDRDSLHRSKGRYRQ